MTMPCLREHIPAAAKLAYLQQVWATQLPWLGGLLALLLSSGAAGLLPSQPEQCVRFVLFRRASEAREEEQDEDAELCVSRADLLESSYAELLPVPSACLSR